MVHTPSASLMQAGSDPSNVGAYSLPASRPITNSSCRPSIVEADDNSSKDVRCSLKYKTILVGS